MLYDRLVSDLAAAEAAMQRDEIAITGERIGRAQEIPLELAASLDLTARLRKQPEKVAECRQLIEPLRDTWRIAAIETSQREVAAALAGGT
jgi:flagellar protein FliS